MKNADSRGRSHQSGCFRCHKHSPKEYTVVIDAVFGVGLSRTIEGHYKDVIEEMNQIHAEKVAIDIPSGISSLTDRCWERHFMRT